MGLKMMGGALMNTTWVDWGYLVGGAHIPGVCIGGIYLMDGDWTLIADIRAYSLRKL